CLKTPWTTGTSPVVTREAFSRQTPTPKAPSPSVPPPKGEAKTPHPPLPSLPGLSRQSIRCLKTPWTTGTSPVVTGEGFSRQTPAPRPLTQHAAPTPRDGQKRPTLHRRHCRACPGNPCTVSKPH